MPSALRSTRSVALHSRGSSAPPAAASAPPAAPRTPDPHNGGTPGDFLNTRTQSSPDSDASLARLGAELRRFHRWVYQVLLGGLVPPLTLFLIVAGGTRKRASWYVPRCWWAGLQRPDEICLAGEALIEPFSALVAVLHATLEQAATVALADPQSRGGHRRYRRVKALAETIGLSLQRSRGGRWLAPHCSPTLREQILTEFVPNWEIFTAVRDAPPAPRRPKAPRWTCACPRARSIRRVRFNARCRVCGAPFVRVDPWPPPRPVPTPPEYRRASPDPLAHAPHSNHPLAPAGVEAEPAGERARVRGANGGELPASGVEPSYEPAVAECRRLVHYGLAKLSEPGQPLSEGPILVVQPQGRRTTPTWFVPAAWHGAGPPRHTTGGQARPEIGIAAEALAEPWVVYAGVLHELVHLANVEANVSDVHPRRNYHNTAFRDLAESIGLIVERDGSRGWAVTSLSAELRHRLETDFRPNLAAFGAFRPEVPPAPGLPRWECGCPIRLRGARLAIHCHDCHTDFARIPDPTAEATPPASPLGIARTVEPSYGRTFLPLSQHPPPPAPAAP